MAGSGTAHLRADRDRTLLVEDLVVEFGVRGGTVHAVSGLNLDLLPGETLGILGESGCGKSSAGRAVMQLPPPTSGAVSLGGVDLTGLHGNEMREARSRMQLVLQDPVSALNPRRKVKDLVAEGLEIWGWGERDRLTFVDELLASVGLDPDVVRDRHPHELSGGQCQRVCIARSIALDPDVLICDEPVSSLDVSVQAQILNLLEQARERLGLSMIFIAHDVAKLSGSGIGIGILGGSLQIKGVDNVIVAASGDLLVAEDGGNMEIVLITPDRVVAPLLRIESITVPSIAFSGASRKSLRFAASVRPCRKRFSRKPRALRSRSKT